MGETAVERDERTVAVENASYRWGYLVMSFGLLVLVMYRSFVLGQAAWDLMALVVLGGAIPSAYQGANNILTRRWARLQIAAMVTAIVIAAVIAFTRR